MLVARETFSILFIVIAIHTSWQTEILSEDNDVCRLFKDGVSLRKPGYCNQLIQCKDHKSVALKTCTGNTPIANTKGKCAATSSDAYCKAPCKTKSPTWVVDPKNCQGWYQCNGATKVYEGYCPDGMHFNQTKGACVYSNLSTCEATYLVCDVAPVKTSYKDEAYCNKYYQCISSGLSGAKEKSFTCPAGQYFDVDKAECYTKAKVPCEKYPYPDNVCGTTKLAIRGRFVSDGATCRGYFYCKDKGSGVPDPEPKWGQCGVDKFFSVETQVCLTRTHVDCEEDRCDGRESGKELSATYGCQHYLVCKDNATEVEEYCGPGLYFDPATENCISKRIVVPICS